MTVKSRPRVRIPPTPPEKSSKPKGFGDFCFITMAECLDTHTHILQYLSRYDDKCAKNAKLLPGQNMEIQKAANGNEKKLNLSLHFPAFFSFPRFLKLFRNDFLMVDLQDIQVKGQSQDFSNGNRLIIAVMFLHLYFTARMEIALSISPYWSYIFYSASPRIII